MNNSEYRGFDLKSVTWGYRDLFRRAIDNLFEQKLLGEQNEETTEIFFGLLSESRGDNICFDHILKNFLVSLNSGDSWILKIPSIFSAWTNLGAEYARYRVYMGLNYFETWGKGGFGNTPEDVSYVINKAVELKSADIDFSYYFILGYAELRKHLSNDEIDVFVESALKILTRNPERSYSFLQLKTKTARVYVQSISKEIRLRDIKERMAACAGAVAGRKIEISDFSGLDSDDLIECGSSMVCMDRWLYVPAKVSYFPERRLNLEYYMFTSVVSGAVLFFRSFATVHGAEGASTSLEYIRERKYSDAGLLNNCFAVFETYRVLSSIHNIFPGVQPVMKRILAEELKNRKAAPPAEEILAAGLKKIIGRKTRGNNEVARLLALMDSACSASGSFVELLDAVSSLMDKKAEGALIREYFQRQAEPLSFFPDIMFPGHITVAPPSLLAADDSKSNPDKDNEDDADDGDAPDPDEEASPAASADALSEQEESTDKESAETVKSGYFYDEWSRKDQDYYENWCCLHEKRLSGPVEARNVPGGYEEYSRKIRDIFERFKPDLVRKEKYLEQGDQINIDMLVYHMSMRKARIFEKEAFYEKPYVKKRDIAVALLIDMSGSTGERLKDGRKTLEVECESAYILGEGLDQTGDCFGIFGFSSAGRENSEFIVFKSFEEKWTEESRKRLFSVSPGGSTRMGVAIRHSGCKLEELANRKKLLIVITDGKPMDSHYDSTSGYAQHDVRKANEENRKKGIDTFCISTEENRIDELELMFPVNRYIVVKSMEELPLLLSKYYLKLTK